jgi:hypothetical protein
MFARCRDAAFVDSGALDDPFIRSVDLSGQVLVGEDLSG